MSKQVKAVAVTPEARLYGAALEPYQTRRNHHRSSGLSEQQAELLSFSCLLLRSRQEKPINATKRDIFRLGPWSGADTGFRQTRNTVQATTGCSSLLHRRFTAQIGFILSVEFPRRASNLNPTQAGIPNPKPSHITPEADARKRLCLVCP